MDAFKTIFTGAPQAKTPNVGQVGGQYEQLLQAYLDSQPQILQAQETYQPQYNALDLQSLAASLNGSGGTPGVLGEYANNILPTVTGAVNAANTSTATSKANTLATAGPGTVTAIKNLNPGQAGLMEQLTQTAGDQLALGTTLDPNQTRQIDESVTANWANRGLGTSNPAQLDEALKYFTEGQSLLGQREATASAVAGQNNQQYTDPAFSVLTGTSSAPAVASGVTSTGTGIAGAAAMPIVSPQQADGMLGTVYNATGSTDIANLNAKAGAASGEISAMSDIAGAGMGATSSW